MLGDNKQFARFGRKIRGPPLGAWSGCRWVNMGSTHLQASNKQHATNSTGVDCCGRTRATRKYDGFLTVPFPNPGPRLNHRRVADQVCTPYQRVVRGNGRLVLQMQTQILRFVSSLAVLFILKRARSADRWKVIQQNMSQQKNEWSVKPTWTSPMVWTKRGKNLPPNSTCEYGIKHNNNY